MWLFMFACFCDNLEIGNVNLFTYVYQMGFIFNDLIFYIWAFLYKIVEVFCSKSSTLRLNSVNIVVITNIICQRENVENTPLKFA